MPLTLDAFPDRIEHQFDWIPPARWLESEGDVKVLGGAAGSQPDPAPEPAPDPSPTLEALLAAAPGPDTAAVLARVAAADLDSNDLVDVVAAFDRLVSWAQSGALAAVAELHLRFDPPRSAPDPHRRVPHPYEPTGVQRLAAELGCALRISDQAARHRIDLAQALHRRLPWVADALQAGLIDQVKARVLVEETEHLDDDHAAAVALEMLGIVGRLTSGQLRNRIRTAVTTIDPESARRRAKKARAQRDVHLIRERDGLASLSALLTENEAASSFAYVEQAARALVASDRAVGLPARPIGQARADAVAALLSGEAPFPAAPVPAATHCAADPTDESDPSMPATGVALRQPTTIVNITVPVSSLLAGLRGSTPAAPCSCSGHLIRPPREGDPSGGDLSRLDPNDGDPADGDPYDGDPADGECPPLDWTLAGLDQSMPGELPWIGAVAPEVARQAALDRLQNLAGGRVGVRWIAVGPDGEAVAITGTSYTAPPLLRAALEARDRTCRFPGCTRPAHQCDCDHNRPYPVGLTSSDNTCLLCRAHHRLRTHSGWRVNRARDGTLAWTSPLGRSYRTHPGLWADPVDPPAESGLDLPELDRYGSPPHGIPPDPALSWSDDDYHAWVEQLCERAQRDTPDGGSVIPLPEATGPDLPPTWWAAGLLDQRPGLLDQRPGLLDQ